MPGKITVACKLPHGLKLRLFAPTKVPDPMPGGGFKEVTQYLPDQSKGMVEIKGYLEKYDPALPTAAKTSSYALTHGVDKDFFEEWLEQNKDHDAVVNKLIFASEKRDELNGLLKDHEKTRSGLEPLNPANLKGKIKTFTAETA